MDTISVSELRRTLRAVLDGLGGDVDAVYVTRYGRPVAVLVEYAHYERLKARVDAGSPTASSGKNGHPRPGAQYPTVANPPSSLRNWHDLIPDGYEGDALADTEALYDEV